MAFTLVQPVSPSFTFANAVSTVSQAYPSNNTAGNLLVAMIHNDLAGAGVTSVTDTAGNTWYSAGTNDINISTIYYCPSCIGGPNTVTAHNGNSLSVSGISVVEYSGQYAAFPLGNCNSPNGNVLSQGYVNAPVAGMLMIAMFSSNNQQDTWSAFTGGTLQTPGSSVQAVWGDNQNCVLGINSITSTQTGPATPDFIGRVVSFYPASYSPSSTIPALVRNSEGGVSTGGNLVSPVTTSPASDVLPACKSGNLIVVAIWQDPSTVDNITGVTDTIGSVYTKQRGSQQVADNGNHGFYSFWTAPITTTSYTANVVTAAFTGSVPTTIGVMEFSAASANQDTDNIGYSGLASYNLNAAVANELIVTLNGTSLQSLTSWNGNDVFRTNNSLTGATLSTEINYRVSVAGNNTISAQATGGPPSNFPGSFSIALRPNVVTSGLTFVQVSPTEATGTTISSLAQAYSTNTTFGSLLLAEGLTSSTGATLSVMDSIGNTWTQIGSYQSSAGQVVGVFYAVNKSSGANTVTLHASASATMGLWLAEYTGQAPGANPIDITAITGNQLWSETGTGTVNFGSITTTGVTETLIFMGRSGLGSTALTSQDGSFVRGAANILLQDRVVTNYGTYSSAFSTSSSGNSGPGIFFAVKTPGSGTGPGFLQGTNIDFGSGGTSGGLAYPANNTAGNLLVCLTRFTNNSGTYTISDSQGNTWVPIYNTTYGGTQHMLAAYALNCNGGPNTVTVNNVGGSAGFIRMAIGEWTGVPTAAIVEGPTAIGASSNVTTSTTPNLTTIGTRDLLIAFSSAITTGVTVPSVNNGFIVRVNGGNSAESDVTIADTVLPAGTYSAIFTYSTTETSNAGLIAFKTAVSGGPGTLFVSRPIPVTAVNSSGHSIGLTSPTVSGNNGQPTPICFTDPNGNEYTTTGSSVDSEIAAPIPVVLCNQQGQPIVPPIVFTSGSATLSISSTLTGKKLGQPTPVVLSSSNGFLYTLTGFTYGTGAQNPTPVALCDTSGNAITGTIAT